MLTKKQKNIEKKINKHKKIIIEKNRQVGCTTLLADVSVKKLLLGENVFYVTSNNMGNKYFLDFIFDKYKNSKFKREFNRLTYKGNSIITLSSLNDLIGFQVDNIILDEFSYFSDKRLGQYNDFDNDYLKYPNKKSKISKLEDITNNIIFSYSSMMSNINEMDNINKLNSLKFKKVVFQ